MLRCIHVGRFVLLSRSSAMNESRSGWRFKVQQRMGCGYYVCAHVQMYTCRLCICMRMDMCIHVSADLG